MENVIDAETYARERAVCDRAEAYWKSNAKSCSGWSTLSAEKATHPDWTACDNDMRGRVEQFEILQELPERFIAYLSSDCRLVTVWTGLELGKVRLGRPYRSNMGDERYPFRASIGGAEYSGTGYGGGGMHARLRKLKDSRPASS